MIQDYYAQASPERKLDMLANAIEQEARLGLPRGSLTHPSASGIAWEHTREEGLNHLRRTERVPGTGQSTYPY